MKKIYLSILFFVLLWATNLQAVSYYSCDFEKPGVDTAWTFNPVANATIDAQIKNRWYLGALGNYGAVGSNGLYISSDNGQTVGYSSVGSVVMVYTTIALDPIANDSSFYQLTFDYRSAAVLSNEGLYCFLIPCEDPLTLKKNVVMSNPNGGQIPTMYEPYMLELQPGFSDNLNGAEVWQQCVTKIDPAICTGQPYYLAFAWNTGNSTPARPGGCCIDNINIRVAQECTQPKNLQVEVVGGSVLVTWEGDADTYEFDAYSYIDDRWYGPILLKDTFYQMIGMTPGQVDFYVRSQCNDSLYSLRTSTSELIYYPDQLCIDYLNLNKAKCYIHNSAPVNTETYDDFLPSKPIDYGPASSASRHTVHYNQLETDPRTGGLLKTVPKGELASIRLGNIEGGNEAERIELSFVVDTIESPVFLLNYAPVIEAPGHEDYENPRFKLDLLINGQSIGSCGQADFNCNDVYSNDRLTTKDTTWHLTTKDVAGSAADIVWKEWTTVGVNLRNPQYQGKTLTARLTTHDCTFSAHGGYAYFTLGCSDGKLKDMKCGEINPNFIAPDGFYYRWLYADSEKYRRADGSIDEKYVLGRSQTYVAGWHTDSLYAVDCMFVQDTTCYFTLYASTLAMNPVSIIPTPRIQRNCTENMYTVFFDGSQCHVQEIDHVNNDTLISTRNRVERIEWQFGDGTVGYEQSPVHKYPASGGTYNITLRTTFGSCDSVVTYVLHLDSLGPTRDTTTLYLCDDIKENGGYQWIENGKRYTEYGLDSIILVNPETTCDSILYLNLLEPTRVKEETVVFDKDLPYVYHGIKLYSDTTIKVASASCDTIWELKFQVYVTLKAKLEQDNYHVCHGDVSVPVNYTIQAGFARLYSVDFEDKTRFTDIDKAYTPNASKGTWQLPVDIPGDLMPNIYQATLTLHDSIPECDVHLPFSFVIRYSNDIIAQRWGDVLGVQNASFNQHMVNGTPVAFEFEDYQWYTCDATGLDTVAIVGANQSYLYQPLDYEAYYCAAVTRTTDKVRLLICPVQPSIVEAQEHKDMPSLSLIDASSQLQLSGKGQAQWYDLMGNLHSQQTYNNSTIQAPNTTGMYLLVLIEEIESTIQRVVIK
jgi:hypothetical protein